MVLPLLAAALTATGASAQQAAPAAAPAATAPAPAPAPAAVPAPAAAPLPACELHVWPAARVSAVTQGVGAGFGILGALIDSAAHADQNKRDTAFITGALDAHSQARVLRDLDLPARLHLPPSQVIIHEQGIDTKSNDPKRLSDSGAACYSEFVVRGLLYFKNAAYKGQMRTFLEMRKFDGAAMKVDFHDSRHENLTVKLPKEGEDTGPATDSLLSAFKGDVLYFADKFTRKNP
ncbi:MAG: hypothetical protein KGN34_03955 [Sphingomonadales bacterium]|nr:hypothetical protein [Sphingomonadales bacterium]